MSGQGQNRAYSLASVSQYLERALPKASFREIGKSSLRVKPSYAVALLLIAALAYWVWFGMTQRSIIEDEGISILAARGILEHGVMKLPSGYIYHRGLLPHYLVAGAIGTFGENDFSIMLPSVVMAIGSLFMTYIFARRVIGGAWVGVAAVVLLLAVQLETFYATSPRMYMSLQFFTLLAAYSAWRGFIEGVGKFKALVFLALAFALLSGVQGILPTVSIPISLFVIARLTGRRLSSIVSWGTITGVVGVLATAWFVIIYSPPSPVPLITAYAGPGVATVFGVNLNMIEWAKQALTLGRSVPIIAALLPLVVFVIFTTLHRRWRHVNPGLIYALTVATLSGLGLVIGTTRTDVRLWLFIVPLFAIVYSAGTLALLTFIAPVVKRRADISRLSLAALVLSGGVLLSIAVFGFLTVGTSSKVGLVTKVVGVPCRGWNCDISIKNHYLEIRDQIHPGDLIISSNPYVTYYYLGRVDGYLREKVVIDNEGNISRIENLKDEYFGIPVMDAGELQELLNLNRRVWIITDRKMQWLSSDEVPEILNNSYQRYKSDDLMTTFIH